MSTKTNEKWSKTFPPSIGNQTRPTNGVDDTQAFETGGFPCFIDNDPVKSDLQNAMMTQAMSNDARLKELLDKQNKDLDAHKIDSAAHATGISGNAASATKLKNLRNIKLTGKATGTAAFDGTADANIKVTSVTADKCVGNSATATQTTATAANNSTADLVKGSMASTDSFRLRVGGKDDAGWAEIATGDNGNEPIYVRQYTGEKATRSATLLDGSGNSSFPGKIVATNGFSGHLYGKADTAGRADVATSADAITWGHVTGKPAAYPPAGHNHDTLYPSVAGARATGTWGINITGSAGSSNVAKLVGKDGGTGGGMKFHWSGQNGQPTWLWGGSNGTDMYVYNPSNFSVNYAKSAGAVAWGSITGKPATYAPSTHNHDSSYPSTAGARATGTWKINVTGSAGSVAWNNVTGKPGWTTDSTKAAKTGWTRLPGDMIMQWGVVSGDGTLTITYPIKFTTFAVPVFAGVSTFTGDDDDQNPAILSQSLTGFTANASLGNQTAINWIAIGK